MSDQETLAQFLARKRHERPPLPRIRGVLGAAKEAGLQADTAMRSAAKALTFGHANEIAAGGASLWGDIDNLGQRYRANLAREDARDRYDSVHRKGAQKAGELGALAISMMRGGPLLTAAMRAPRLPGAAAITGKEAVSALAAGGFMGAGGQAVGDVLTGKQSSPGDYTGAAIGGVVGTAALPFGPSTSAAANGAVTSVAQDVLNGRPPSVERAAQGALAARALGKIADKAAAIHTDSLPPLTKGRLGETMGAFRSAADIRPRDLVKQKLYPATSDPKGRKWRPDGVYSKLGDDIPTVLYEDKFGWDAVLSDPQKLAQASLPNFQLNHFLPVDVGLAASVPAASFGLQAHDRLNQRRTRP